MGTSVNAQTTTNNPYVKAVNEMRNIFIRRVFSVWKENRYLFKFSSDFKLYTESLNIILGFTKSIIERKKKEKRSRVVKIEESEDDVGSRRRIAFLDMLLESTMDGRVLTDEEIREEVDTFMFEVGKSV